MSQPVQQELPPWLSVVKFFVKNFTTFCCKTLLYLYFSLLLTLEKENQKKKKKKANISYCALSEKEEKPKPKNHKHLPHSGGGGGGYLFQWKINKLHTLGSLQNHPLEAKPSLLREQVILKCFEVVILRRNDYFMANISAKTSLISQNHFFTSTSKPRTF